MMPDLRNTNVLIILWAMPGCGACDEFLPRFLKQIDAAGAPFHVWSPGEAIPPGMIPVMLYDAASENAELQAFADKLGVTATPTLCVMTRQGSTKIEGAMPDRDVKQLLEEARALR